MRTFISAFSLGILISTAGFAAELSDLLDEWLNDPGVADSRAITLAVELPKENLGELTGYLAKLGDVELESYTFRNQVLTLRTTKAVARTLNGDSKDFAITRISALSDLGNLAQAYADIATIRQEVRDGTETAKGGAARIRTLLSSEFRLKRDLTPNDVAAIAVAAFDSRLENLRSQELIDKVRYGNASRRFGNERSVHLVRGGTLTPPVSETPKTHTFIPVRAFPAFDGSDHVFREVAFTADAFEYFMAAKLPKGYAYEQAKGFSVDSPSYQLVISK